MTRSRPLPWWWAPLLFLAGCGGGGAHRTTPPQLSPSARAVARAEATHEYPSPAAPAQHARGSPSARQAITAFARLYINWNAEDVSAHMTRLARASIGQARSEMVLAAAETRADTTIQQGGISNRGAVEAVVALNERSGRFLVVTREATRASASGAYQGLAPAWHVTLATVAQVGPPATRRWVVSEWRPES